MNSSDQWQSLLSAIQDEMRTYGLSTQPACDDKAIESLSKNVVEQFKVELPASYKAFLRHVNGLDWNGLVLYASARSQLAGFADRSIEGIIEANTLHRDDVGLKDYLALGEDGTVLYAYHIPSRAYRVLTSVGHSVLETHTDCDSLIAAALTAHR